VLGVAWVRLALRLWAVRKSVRRNLEGVK